MQPYLQIYRPLNVLFIVLAQFFAGYFLNFSADIDLLIEYNYFWLILATASSAVYGYWFNDLMDRDRDQINEKGVKYIHRMDKPLVYIHLLLFLFVAVYAANHVNMAVITLVIATLVFLTLYSLFFKNLPGLGNLLIAALCFVSIYAVSWVFDGVDRLLVIHFSVLAGMVTLSRELVKDMEDIKGDLATRARTLPIAIGTGRTSILVYILLLFVMSFLVVSLYYQQNFLSTPLKYVYYSYCLLFIIIPLYKAAVDVRFAKEKGDYQQLSLILKYVLYTGVLSMLFF